MEIAIKHPHLTALMCFLLAGLLYFALPSTEYGAAFLLLGVFFALLALKATFGGKPK